MDGVSGDSSQVHTHEINGTDGEDWTGGYTMSTYQRFRHSDWATFRAETFHVLEAAGATQATLRRFIECGGGCQVYHSPSEQKLYVKADTCKNRFCQPCARARRGQIAENLRSFAAGKHLRLLTLTIAHHNQPLPDLMTRMWGSFKLLRRRPDWQAHVRGYAAFMELKWSERSQWWHVHLHILCEGSWWDSREISKAWHTVTADSFVIDIREVSSEEGINYTAKYASKPLSLADIPQAQRVPAVQALHHRRIWQVGGEWKGECKLLATKPLPADLQYVASFASLLDTAKRGDQSALEILTRIVGGHAIEIDEADPDAFDDS
jgi:hypothetical protein